MKVENDNGVGLVIWNNLIKIQEVALIILSVCVVSLMSLLVIFRYILKIDLFGIEEIVVIFAFWLYFIGGSFGSYTRSHITADVITMYIKDDRLRDKIKLVTSFVTVVLSFILTYYALDFFIWGINKGARTAVVANTLVIPQSSVFIGYAIMTFYFSVYLINDLKIYQKSYK